MGARRKTIFISITVFIIGLKLNYEYYNFIFPVILIFVVCFSFQRDKKLGAVLVILHILCLFTTDKFVYKSLNNEKYFWSEKEITLVDFKGIPDDKSDVSAKVFPSIIGKINKVFNYPPAIVFASNEVQKSWINISFFDSTEQHRKVLKKLLIHEKMHLSITEIYTRKVQDSLNGMIFSNISSKYLAIDFLFKKSDSVQDLMDKETSHGLNAIKNDEWNKYIMKELEN